MRFEDSIPYPVPEGYRWVEVQDDRLTNGVRLDVVPVDAPDPEPVVISPEQAARGRLVLQRLRNGRSHYSPQPTTPAPPKGDE